MAFVFLRAHNPTRYGDTINRHTMKKSISTGLSSYGVELGPFGTLTLRRVLPWKIKDKLVGYIELGEEIDNITPALRKILNIDIVFVINKKYLNKELWQEGQKILGHSGNWGQFSNYALIDKTTSPIPKEAFDHLTKVLDQEKGKTEIFSWDHAFLEGLLPLRDVSGKTLGKIIILKNIAKEKELLWKQFSIILMLFVLAGGMFFIFFYFYLGKIEKEAERSKRKIKKAKKYYEQIIQTSPSAIYTVDKNKKITSWNKRAEELTGYIKEEVIGKPCHIFAESPCKEECGLFAKNKEKPIFGAECIIKKKDGEIRYISKNVDLLYNDHNNIIGGIESFEDITDHKKHEEELAKREKSFRALYMSSQDAIMIAMPPDWRFTSGNPATVKMFGAKDENHFISKAPWELSPEFQPDGKPSKEKAQKMIEKAIKEGKNFFEWTHKRFDGTEFFATVLLTRVELEKGKPFFQATVRDITEAKKAEKAVAEAAEIKSQFISMVSHELRTPLGPIKEGAGIILDGLTGKINEKQRNLLVIVKRNADRLGRFVNDVLDFQKLQADKVIFNLTENDINESIRDIHKSMALVTKHKGLKFNIELDENIPLMKFDKDKIDQVFTNILNNAIKFTDKGGIKITSKKEKNLLHVMVSDTGPGIKKEDIHRLFQTFQQLDTVNLKKEKGTGLGLAISKEIILRHNGKIWVESEYGTGTTFHFSLPIKDRREKNVNR